MAQKKKQAMKKRQEKAAGWLPERRIPNTPARPAEMPDPPGHPDPNIHLTDKGGKHAK